MSVLSIFVATQLLKYIDSEFANHDQATQEAVIKQIEDFVSECIAWIDSKIDDAIDNYDDDEEE